MNSLKKSIQNILKDQLENLELVNSLLDVYINSEDYKSSNTEIREAILNLKKAQSEHLNAVNKYLKY